MGHVEYSVKDGIAVLAFQLPPVNSLSHALRVDLIAAIDRAIADPAAAAMVLIGANGTFCAGADIKEFSGTGMWREPHILNLMSVLDDSPKPVVAAIEGVALGGGLELAMACHYRVVLASAKLGLPEVKLGLIPGAGGTQRLPRLIGVEAALNVMLAGEPLPATLFAKTPLIDRLVEKNLLDAAMAFAGEVVDARRADAATLLPRARDRKIEEPNLEALLQFARNTVRTAFKEYPAPLAIIDAVQAAAKLPFEQGMVEERRMFEPLMASPVSKALRHIFFAERAAQRVEGLPPKTPARQLESVAIIGAGTMGTGIAINFLNAGLPTWLLEVGQEALERGVARVREFYAGQVKKGRMDPTKAESRMALLKPTLAYTDIANADLVIEAVFEDMGVKEKVFRQLDAIMKPGAILATNTSTLDVDRIAAFTGRPQDVLGLHFFSPANVMKLLEVVRGAKTAPEVLASALGLAKLIRKTAVVSGVCDGFIGNRMINQYFAQALQMVDEGASPQQIDAAIEGFGFAMGPFRMSDLAGNDISYHIRQRQYAEGKLKQRAAIADKLCELGRHGQKTGAGWYDYRPGDRNAHPSPVVDKLIADERAEAGATVRKLPQEEIVDRLVFALVNEGARILEEGIAQRASDIDLVYLTGYGFPIWRGGPMQYADSLGLYAVVRRMGRLAANPRDIPGFWVPAPRLARLAAEGGSLNGGAA
ncbi:MAG: 3-hydroxyacyl-CoA dehydrogenase NAD-binding domain-containing protein [Steroidobacteraceae bacterium]|nr:enoyl-CoA hydratase/isomerase family protein [Nevskiaceae bacterium]MCP5339343.1 enoyl-CoA hydratase/isomerase family protein [Nevskiaceae bacterium]MCP5466526.1 enoyl-CoA hydratase/isomerase family protein [Nevskiaceae bacterium]MCP5471376.1 enoyl-CoA hydratase/isomerase family protein [Nevskiaceae bacterium]